MAGCRKTPDLLATVCIKATEMTIDVLVEALADINAPTSHGGGGKNLNGNAISPNDFTVSCIKAVDDSAAGEDRALCRPDIKTVTNNRRRGGKIYGDSIGLLEDPNRVADCRSGKVIEVTCASHAATEC